MAPADALERLDRVGDAHLVPLADLLPAHFKAHRLVALHERGGKRREQVQEGTRKGKLGSCPGRTGGWKVTASSNCSQGGMLQATYQGLADLGWATRRARAGVPRPLAAAAAGVAAGQAPGGAASTGACMARQGCLQAGWTAGRQGRACSRLRCPGSHAHALSGCWMRATAAGGTARADICHDLGHTQHRPSLAPSLGPLARRPERLMSPAELQGLRAAVEGRQTWCVVGAQGA